ncbi:amino acid adenylation domain-containing protein [Pedobacter cryoconitis]|uniref:Amino acid adenylation domain-containing protein n=1 Tax=Pedobacter cryoconitis TaxID=188932 RepID=A0A7W8YYQ7_9SPHI|nr:non-ribosomal peptide synthetase [Pedobacter cryoconitis]MBB5624256.1 amino acid adenylation domain-containing protein [Pedobacter cryoconitis]
MIEDVFSLTPLQEGLYYHWLTAPGSPVYFEQMSFRLKGDLNIEVLEKSYASLVSRHGILRTVFTNNVGEKPLQIVKKEVTPVFKYIDTLQEPSLSVADYKVLDRAEGFDLHSGSQMRLTILDLGDQVYEFIWSHHHILMDGWCMSILINEFLSIYGSLVRGNKPRLNKVYPYSDYIKWLSKLEPEESLAYWNKYLTGSNGLSTLPKLTVNDTDGYQAEESTITLDDSLRQAVKELCGESGVTENTFMQTVWGILLASYNHTNDVVFGAVVSGRPAEVEGIEEMIGFFINTVPVRVQLDEKESITALLKRIQASAIEGTAHHYTQLADIQVDNVGVFDHIVVFENYPVQQLVEQSIGGTEHTGGLSLISSAIFEQTNYDFTLVILPGDKLCIKFKYNKKVYDQELISRLEKQLVLVIRQITENPAISFQEIDYLSKEEKQTLLFDFNAAAIVAYPNDQTIINLFEEQVKQTPDHLAVVFENSQLTYGQLNELSNQLGDYLRKIYAVQVDDLIGIQLERSDWTIVAILGVLKSGGACVPIDPEYPQERIDYMVADSQCKLVIDEKVLGGFKVEREAFKRENPIPVAIASSLAYLIYTSGSTGKPKGVMVEHSNIVRLVKSPNYVKLSDQDRLLGLSNFSFDASLFEVFGALLNGASLFVGVKDVFLDFNKLGQTIAEQGISVFFLTTALFNSLVDVKFLAFSKLRYLLFGGELVSLSHVKRFRANHPEVNLVHVYGPTENTTFSSYYPVKEVDEVLGTIPIGSAISNSQCYIFNGPVQCGKLSPVGVAGEICLGGDGLARGYLNRPELTEEKFVANPFVAGEKIYRTGDLGRWLPDGSIEFIGRQDDQVKIRGHRIEPGEIANMLQENKEVEGALVLALPNQDGEYELVAYIVTKLYLNPSNIRLYLSRKLPAYMIPAHFVLLDEFPLTANGKIDKKRLPDPSGAGSGTEYLAPRNETEEKLVSIWQKILKKEKIGVLDNFFEIGGHSLKATRLASQLHKEFDVKVELKEIFSNAVLEAQARLIQQAVKTSFIAIAPAPVQASYPMSSSQRRLWILSQFEDGNSANNMPGVYEFEGELEPASLAYAFKLLIERHEILRTVFRADEKGDIRQFIFPANEVQFTIPDFDLRGEKQQYAKLKSLLQHEFTRPFELAEGPLVRASLYQTEDHKWIFTYTLHHIISDGWSMGIMINELLLFYNSHRKGEANPLASLRIQYKDYAVWQQEQLSGETLKGHKDYWLKQFEGELPVMDLPGDRTRPAVKTYNGGVIYKTIAKDLASELRSFSQEQGATLFMSLLAVVNTLLYRYTGDEDIITGSPIAGREHIDLDDQIGFYVNTLSLRTRFKGTDNFKDLLAHVKQVTLGAYEHQIYPFDELVDALNLKGDISRNPLFDVLVELQNNETSQSKKTHTPEKLKVKFHEEEINLFSRFDLSFSFLETANELTISIEYNSDLFDNATALRMAAHVEQLISAVVKEPLIPVQQLNYLSEQEKYKLINEFNTSAPGYPLDKTFIELFEEQAANTPDHIAVIFNHTALTYRELNETVNQFGNYLLQTYELKADDLVGLKLERSEWVLIAILGVFKSGAAYVPIDPDYPQERVNYITTNANCKLLIDAEELSRFANEQFKFSKNNRVKVNAPGDLAYVIYTSGSTGSPKGSMIEHAGMLNHLFAMKELLAMDSNSKIVQNASYTFDISVWQFLNALIIGGTTIIYDRETILNPALFIENLIAVQATILQVVPSYLKTVLDLIAEGKTPDLSAIKYLSVTGEAVSQPLLKKWFEVFPEIKVLNAYGPAEASDDVTLHIMDKAPAEMTVPVGRPIQNMNVYILDKLDKLCPIGVAGEICVSGIGVGRGYLNDAKRTTENFVIDPFHTEKSVRMYRTGDTGRWLADGNVEFIGRKDDQVKIRGHRIELGEIEKAVQQYSGIEEVVVIAKKEPTGENNLVAYLISNKNVLMEEIRGYLLSRLPVYMVPAYFVQLDKLPLSANGKVDKKALPDPESIGLKSGIAYVAARNETEERLVEIWETLLDKEKISVKDNFFELGGHSLLAIRLISKIHEQFDVKIGMTAFFQAPVIETMALYLEAVSFKEQGSVDATEELIF